MPLQRAVTDFGADAPFAQAMDKLVEHYRVVLAESTIRRITEGHAQALFEAVELDESSWDWSWSPAAGIYLFAVCR